MKALTLWQPWATLVAIGAKKIETRSWGTDYRGPLAIHAAKNFPGEAQDLCNTEPFARFLREAGYGNEIGVIVPSRLPRGMIVATCELVNVVQIDRDFYIPARPEFDFGDYSIGRFAWFLSEVEELFNPILAIGKQGLWEWEEP